MISNPLRPPTSSEFQRWFKGASKHVRNADGTSRLFYRGQTAVGPGDQQLHSRMVLDSFTTSPEIASVYSTIQGAVQEGSSVIPVYLNIKNPLVIQYPFLVFYDVLQLLRYFNGDGLTHEDSVRMLVYLNKRFTAQALRGSFFGVTPTMPKALRGFAKLPSFQYMIKNEDETGAESDFGLDEDALINFDDLGDFRTEPLRVFLNEWKDNGAVDQKDPDSRTLATRLALLLAVDTFALVETPAFVRALRSLGYDGVVHNDSFAAETAMLKVCNKDFETLIEESVLEEECEDYDWPDMFVEYTHWTYRPLDRSQVWPALRPNPARRGAGGFDAPYRPLRPNPAVRRDVRHVPLKQRAFLFDGEPVTYKTLKEVNADDEDFLAFLEGLEVGQTEVYGLPPGAGAASFEIKRVK